MHKADFILELDRRFSRMARNPRGVSMAVPISTRNGESVISISHSDWAKCRSRFARWDLLRSRINHADA